MAYSLSNNSNSNSRICSAPPTVSPKVHYVVSRPTRCEEEKTSDGAAKLLHKCTKKFCKRTVLVQLIVEDVVRCFLGTKCIFIMPPPRRGGGGGIKR